MTMRKYVGLVLGMSTLVSATAHAQPTAPEPPPPVEPWYEALDFGLFADAYASFNTNLPKPQAGTNLLRAYDTTNGFALSWVGADISYAPAPVGGTLSLRLGPTAQTYAASCFSDETPCDADIQGLAMVKQAFASWQPRTGLTFDFGKFDQPFGAEVAESQNNLNYSRGVLYWYAQPLFHTGLRTRLRILPELDLLALVVNGWNNSIDNNVGKTFGLQAIARPTPTLTVTAGWLGGPEQDDAVTLECPVDTAYSAATGACSDAPGLPGGVQVVDRGDANQPEAWRHLVDVVATWQPSPVFTVTANGDYGVEGVRSIGPNLTTEVDAQSYWGVMLGSRYSLTDVWAVAARGEYFADADGYATGFSDLQLVTGTLTMDAAPTPNLLLRLEGRGDFAVDAAAAESYLPAAEQKDEERDIFPAEVRQDVSHQLTVLFSAVVRI